MITNNIHLGYKKIFTNSYFSFTMINTGTTDLFVYDMSTSSNNIYVNYINIPFTIPINSIYEYSGYLKIIKSGKSYNNDYIDLYTYYIIGNDSTVFEIYRYYLDYIGIVDVSYTNIFYINNIDYIRNVLIVYIEAFVDDTNFDFPNIVIESIDDDRYFIFPSKYRVSKNIMAFVFTDNYLINKIINDKITFLCFSYNSLIKINNISWRTI